MYRYLFFIAAFIQCVLACGPACAGTDLGTLSDSSSVINDLGQATENSSNVQNNSSMSNANGSDTNSGSLGGTNSSASVNNSNCQNVSHSGFAGGFSDRGFMHQNGKKPDWPWGKNTNSNGINDGKRFNDHFNPGKDRFHVCRNNNHQTNNMDTLDVANSEADEFSNSEQVGDWSSLSGTSGTQGLINPDGQMIDSNSQIDLTSGGGPTNTASSNDTRQIMGDGYAHISHQPFLVTHAPEPSTFVLLSMSAIYILFCARQQRKRVA